MSNHSLRFATIAIIILISLTACRNHPIPGELNTPLELSFNRFRELESEGLRLAFLEVTADNRCPVDADCISPGDAELLVRVLKDGARLDDLSIQVGDLNPRPTYVVGDYIIDVIELQPASPSDNEAGYTLLIEVSRAQ